MEFNGVFILHNVKDKITNNFFYEGIKDVHISNANKEYLAHIYLYFRPHISSSYRESREDVSVSVDNTTRNMMAHKIFN